MGVSGGIGQAPFGFLPSGSGGGGGGGGTSKQPLTFIIGTTLGAPASGATTWTNSLLQNSWLALNYNTVDMAPSNPANGNPYFTKASKATGTVNFFNIGAGFSDGDVLIVTFV